MNSPTSRTLEALRLWGATAQVVERWNPHSKTRLDLFGFADVLAMLGDNLIAVQATSGPHHANRKEKILAEPRAARWLRCGNLIELWSWSKQGARGKRKLWTARKEEITLADFQSVGVA